jgi:NAD(P)-dependent dehydrogenase (short-subunit alcohol dehydrogenase family)
VIAGTVDLTAHGFRASFSASVLGRDRRGRRRLRRWSSRALLVTAALCACARPLAAELSALGVDAADACGKHRARAGNGGSGSAGRLPIPFMGMYSASKCAVEGYTEALRMELKPLNIHVSQIEPGFLKSPMMDKRQVVAERIGDYEPWRQRAFKATRDAEEKGLRPERVAEAVSKILASPAPRLRYMVGGQANVISRLKRFFPERAFEMGARSTFKLDRDA